MTDDYNFDEIAPIEVPITVKGERFILHEATGDAACKYGNAMSACYHYGPEGNISSITGMADVQPLLISLCLTKENGARVSEDVVRSWPARVQKSLFKRAKEISDLDVGDDALESLMKQRDEIDRRIARLKGEPVKN